MYETAQDATKARYEHLTDCRQPYLDRARECALYTIPSLIPPEGHTPSSKYATPYQSLGARGINNLASKMLLTLLPPNTAWFRLMADLDYVKKVREQGGDEGVLAMESALSQLEQRIIREIERRALRIQAYECFKHMIVAGNVLISLTPKGAARVFPLHQYVVDRDPEGSVLEIIVKEVVSPLTLPKDFREKIVKYCKEKNQKTVDLYTVIKLDEETSRWKIHQEVCGEELPDSHGDYPEGKCPWLALRWTRIDGEAYGRGLCEEYLGDLLALEGLSRAILEASVQAARTIWLVNPSGVTRQEVLAKLPNGGIAEGKKEDVSVVQMDKYADFQIAKATLDGVEQRISYAFLLNSAVQRNAERVTAEEVRYMAAELENALGGVYSVQAQEFQLPLVQIVMSRMEKEGDLPTIKPAGVIEPTIVTGLDALGRNAELMKLDAFVGDAYQKLGPQAQQYLVVSGYLKMRATAMGLDTKGLVREEADVQAMNDARMTHEMATKVAPNVVNQAGAMAQAQIPQPTQDNPNAQ